MWSIQPAQFAVADMVEKVILFHGEENRVAVEHVLERAEWQARDPNQLWQQKWWFADAEAFRANDFNLSASRYRPETQEQIEHRDPLELLDELKAIETEILEEIDALVEKLRDMAA